MFEVGQLSNYPLVCSREALEPISQIVLSNIHLSKSDWDSQETSWDFQECNPLIKKEATMRPVLVLVTSQSKKDALINAKAVQAYPILNCRQFTSAMDWSTHVLKTLSLSNPNAISNVTQLIPLTLLETGCLILWLVLESIFAKRPRNNPFTSLAFATALLYPTGNTASFLDVITCHMDQTSTGLLKAITRCGRQFAERLHNKMQAQLFRASQKSHCCYLNKPLLVKT